MPPTSRGKVGGSARFSGGGLPLAGTGGWAGGRGARRGSGRESGSGTSYWRSGLILLFGLVVLTSPLWITSKTGGSSDVPVELIHHMKHPTMPVGNPKNRDDPLQRPLLGSATPSTSSEDSDEGEDGDLEEQGGEQGEGGEEVKDEDDAYEDAKLGVWVSGGSGSGAGSAGLPQGKDDIHVVFSTDCTGYQAWQALVLFHSAILCGHMGPITQLVSGCSDTEEAEMILRHETTREATNHGLYFSPSFAIEHPVTHEAYPYMNKPNAMQLWLNETEVDETIVALIDPDFIFLKPLTTWMDPKEIVVRGDGLSIEGLKLENGAWVRKGHPAGQRFSLPNWTRWDRTKICPANSVCASATTAMVKRYYDLIPPYLAHKDDWQILLPEWVRQAPKVYEAYPSLLAEQTAYATAAATLNLRHYRLNSYAIENEKVDYEIWDAVDHNMGNVCDIGIEEGKGTGTYIGSFSRIPTFIHYCHMYRVGNWLFNKRRYRKEQQYDQLRCDTPLLQSPPMDIQDNLFKFHPGARYEPITSRSAKRNAFVLCIATQFVNSALRRFKGISCTNGQANLDETVFIK